MQNCARSTHGTLPNRVKRRPKTLKCEHQRLPMGLCDSSDILQVKMNHSLDGADTWEHHLTGLEEVFRGLQQAGLKANAKKSSFGAHKIEHLGCNVARTGIQPIAKNPRAIQAIKVPNTRKQLRGSVGMIDFCQEDMMWKNQALCCVAPLTALTSKNLPCKWTDEHQKNFEAIKRFVGGEVSLACPDFNTPSNV
jgi:hypothetical protein